MDNSYVDRRLSIMERFLLCSSNDIVDAFFARWPVDLVFRIRSLSTTVFCVVEAYRFRTWNPIPLLMPFFRDVRGFLVVLDKCDGIVSGSQVVRFLQRHGFPDRDSDLDIFLPRHGLLQMGRWLKRHGYVYQASGRKHVLFDVEAIRSASVAFGVHPDGTDAYPSTPGSTHFATYHFIRKARNYTPNGAELQRYLIQLVVVDVHPVQYIINNFLSQHFWSRHLTRLSSLLLFFLLFFSYLAVLRWFLLHSEAECGMGRSEEGGEATPRRAWLWTQARWGGVGGE